MFRRVGGFASCFGLTALLAVALSGCGGGGGGGTVELDEPSPIRERRRSRTIKQRLNSANT